MAGKFDDLFSLTPDKPKKDYVTMEATPAEDETVLADAQKAYAERKGPAASKQSPNMNFSSMFSDEMKRPPVSTRAQAPLAGENVETVYPKDENLGTQEPLDVSGKFSQAATEAPSPAPAKGTADTGKGLEIPWDQVLVGSIPYALEALFGGGKYMGSAGAGSAAGSKTYMDIKDKQATAKAKADKDRADEDLAKSKFEFERTKHQDQMNMEKAKLDKPSYKYEQGLSPEGKPVYVGLEAQGREPIVTNVGVQPKVDRRAEISAEYLKQRKLEADMRFKEKAQKDVSPLIETKQSIEAVRERASLSPNFYRNAADPAINTPEAQMDKAAINRLLNSEIFLKGGKTLTANERAMIAGPAGVVPFGDFNNLDGVKSWLASNPENVRKFQQIMETRYELLRQEAQRANTTLEGKNYADIVGGNMTLAPVKEASAATKTMAKSIADELRKERGW